MRALLERHLQGAGLSFPAWTVLVFTIASPLTVDQIAQRQISGHIVSNINEAQLEIDRLLQADLIKASESGELSHTDKGSALFNELSGKVKDITQSLYADLPGADLEATHRTLLEIAKRANAILTSSKL
jgi:hypothetical protein